MLISFSFCDARTSLQSRFSSFRKLLRSAVRPCFGMLRCGMSDEARTYVEDYWGGMIDKGADTFWEAYDPTDDLYSPYGFHPLNSACHAWSCTPVYFIHRYPEVFQR